MKKMKSFNNVKSINFKVFFNGKGCVNYDHKGQKFTLFAKNLIKGKVNDNVKFAKKIFEDFKTEDGETKSRFKYKVSTDCLRNNMFKEEMQFANSAIGNLSYIRYNAIATPAMIERGYMFPDTEQSIRKSSVFFLSPAIEEGEWHTIVDMEIHSTSGAKGNGNLNKEEVNSVNEDEKPGSTSLYFCENVGNATYVSEGFIDLTEFQFLSGDMTYDRGCVLVDGGEEEKIYLNALKNHFGEDFKFNCYHMKSDLAFDEWGERGILLTKKAVDMMVKDIFKRIFNINIYRKDALFTFDHIEITVNYGDEQIKFEKLPDIYANNISDIEQYIFNYYPKYELCDEEKIKKNKELNESILNCRKKEKKSSRK